MVLAGRTVSGSDTTDDNKEGQQRGRQAGTGHGLEGQGDDAGWPEGEAAGGGRLGRGGGSGRSRRRPRRPKGREAGEKAATPRVAEDIEVRLVSWDRCCSRAVMPGGLRQSRSPCLFPALTSNYLPEGGVLDEWVAVGVLFYRR